MGNVNMRDIDMRNRDIDMKNVNTRDINISNIHVTNLKRRNVSMTSLQVSFSNVWCRIELNSIGSKEKLEHKWRLCSSKKDEGVGSAGDSFGGGNPSSYSNKYSLTEEQHQRLRNEYEKKQLNSVFNYVSLLLELREFIPIYRSLKHDWVDRDISQEIRDHKFSSEQICKIITERRIWGPRYYFARPYEYLPVAHELFIASLIEELINFIVEQDFFIKMRDLSLRIQMDPLVEKSIGVKLKYILFQYDLYRNRTFQYESKYVYFLDPYTKQKQKERAMQLENILSDTCYVVLAISRSLRDKYLKRKYAVSRDFDDNLQSFDLMGLEEHEKVLTDLLNKVKEKLKTQDKKKDSGDDGSGGGGSGGGGSGGGGSGGGGSGGGGGSSNYPEDKKDFPVGHRDSDSELPRDSDSELPRDSDSKLPVDNVNGTDTVEETRIMSYEEILKELGLEVRDESELIYDAGDSDSELPVDDRDSDSDSETEEETELPVDDRDSDSDSETEEDVDDRNSDSDSETEEETEEDVPDQDEYLIKDQKEDLETTKYFQDQDYKKTKKKGRSKSQQKKSRNRSYQNNPDGTQNQGYAPNQKQKGTQNLDSDLNPNSDLNLDSAHNQQGTQNQDCDLNPESAHGTHNRDSDLNQESAQNQEETQNHLNRESAHDQGGTDGNHKLGSDHKQESAQNPEGIPTLDSGLNQVSARNLVGIHTPDAGLNRESAHNLEGRLNESAQNPRQNGTHNLDSDLNLEYAHNQEGTQNPKGTQNLEGIHNQKGIQNQEGTQNLESAQNQKGTHNLDSDHNLDSAQNLEETLNQEGTQNLDSDQNLEETLNQEGTQNLEETLNQEGTQNLEETHNQEGTQNLDSDQMNQEGTQKYGHLWVQCENCYELNYKKYFFETKLNICEHCGFNLKMSSLERIEFPIDQGTWNPMDEDMISTDPIEFDRNPTKTDPTEFTGTPVKTDPIEFDRNPTKTDPIEFTGTPVKTDPTEFTGTPVKTDPTEFTGTPVKTDPIEFDRNPTKTDPIEFTGTPVKTDPTEFDRNPTKTDPIEFDRTPVKTDPKNLDEESTTKIYANSNSNEDSKNPIAVNFTNYADGIDFESESKEENSKEENVSEDCIDFESEEKDYNDRIDSYQEETGLSEAVQTGTGQLNGIPVAIGVMDFQFMGGSMGSVVGEKITRLIEYATKKGLPVILVCASGGARMQEGSLSLMQMAKISAALHKHQTNKKLFYISILTSPTTGGVTASFGMLGDIIITEPDAEIAFAGKRVIEQTLNLTVPEDLQTSEYLFQKGLFDLIIPRNLLKNVLSELLKLHASSPSA